MKKQEELNVQEAQQPVKPHGCVCPFHPLQVLSYVLFFFYAYVFYFIELIALQEPYVLPFILLVPFTLLFLTLAVVAVVATLRDPTDPTVSLERQKKAKK